MEKTREVLKSLTDTPFGTPDAWLGKSSFFEHEGKFLVLYGGTLVEGLCKPELLALRRLAARGITAVVFFGDPNNPNTFTGFEDPEWVWWFSQDKELFTFDYAQRWVNYWNEYVRANPGAAVPAPGRSEDVPNPQGRLTYPEAYERANGGTVVCVVCDKPIEQPGRVCYCVAKGLPPSHADPVCAKDPRAEAVVTGSGIDLQEALFGESGIMADPSLKLGPPVRPATN